MLICWLVCTCIRLPARPISYFGVPVTKHIKQNTHTYTHTYIHIFRNGSPTDWFWISIMLSNLLHQTCNKKFQIIFRSLSLSRSPCGCCCSPCCRCFFLMINVGVRSRPAFLIGRFLLLLFLLLLLRKTTLCVQGGIYRSHPASSYKRK